MSIRRFACSLLLTISLIPAALADTLTVTREGSGTADESAATLRFWTGDNRIARIDDNGKMIADLSSGVLYLVNDQAETCHAMSTRDPDRDAAALKAAVEAVEFRRTGASERIGDWQAEVHELTAGSSNDALEMVVRISDEIAVDTGQRAYTESVATPETAWMLAIYDLGFPVRQEVKMGPVQMWAELQSIERKAGAGWDL